MNKIFWIILAMHLLQACQSMPGIQKETPTKDLRLYVFECGDVMVKDLSIFATEKEKNVEKRFSVSCYVINHPQGILLWDTGVTDAIANKPEGMTGRGGVIHLEVKKPFLSQLAEIGITPKDIKYLALSHFHNDHAGNASAFTSSTLLIQEEEFAAAFGDKPKEFGFDPSFYGALRNSPVKKLHGDFDVFGDGSVIIKRAIGHTPGHQMLFVRLRNTGPVILSGDLYHFTENRIKQRVPSLNFDKAETKKSMTIMEDFVKETGAVMWIQHDFEQNKIIRHAPLFYD
jgi:glyoxylase-like metal-dependent hydrolase (beta-lactamase superfamily II)